MGCCAERVQRPGRMRSEQVPADLVILGASIYDGSGTAPFVGDVAVDDAVVSAVVPTTAGGIAERGAVEENASGLALSPGFIDVHSHDDFAALLVPELPFKV